jgi:hypothetical protein
MSGGKCDRVIKKSPAQEWARDFFTFTICIQGQANDDLRNARSILG